MTFFQGVFNQIMTFFQDFIC